MEPSLPRPSLALGALAFAGGCAWVVGDSLYWYFTQRYVFGQGAAVAEVTGFYGILAAGICLAVVGAWLLGRGLARRGGGPPQSVWTVISETLASRTDVRIGVAGGALYGVAYLFVSSIVVYQPTVNFQTFYGATGTSVAAATCCGSPGTVPELIVYLAPQWHLALQLLPLDALFAAVIPILVGFNVAVAAHALRNRLLRSNAGWLGPVGITAGLFTGCPTCAGLFLAGALGGLGATTLAVALAPYQLLFVALSIPVLIVSPLVVATYAGKAALAACLVPAKAQSPVGPVNP
ncbi:MAG: hypothetical protein JRN57_01020 [Nitrososphaerota archaeon]|nr:hypothetical protein [Nitrososphaerota archaeon]